MVKEDSDSEDFKISAADLESDLEYEPEKIARSASNNKVVKAAKEVSRLSAPVGKVKSAPAAKIQKNVTTSEKIVD